MTSKERVLRAIEFRRPDKMPILYFNKYIERGDIIQLGYKASANFHPADPNESEWGFKWKRVDQTMGQPYDPPIGQWSDLTDYQPPDPEAPGRFDHIPQIIKKHPDQFLMAGLGISGFNFVTYLRGVEETYIDLYEEPENLMRLIHMVYDFETAIIRHYCSFPEIDAVSFADDLGTQRGLIISPDMWREIYKPLYQKQFELIHQHGKKVYLHSCGNIWDIIDDFIEIGVDVFNFNQPDVFGIERLGERFRGRCAFCTPVDHQTVAMHGTEQQIEDYIKRLKSNLSTEDGGYIGYIEEYSSMGMSPETFETICRVFERNRN
ncbi:MAG: uroporphyrinogen decarboxylase family protein [Massiliimalia sp.]